MEQTKISYSVFLMTPSGKLVLSWKIKDMYLNKFWNTLYMKNSSTANII